jgi:hypothetical protein
MSFTKAPVSGLGGFGVARSVIPACRAAAIGIIKHGSAYSLEWVDAICELMTTLYSHEMERLSQERSHARLEEIRGILNGDDLTAATRRRVGSRVSGGHLAVVLRDCAAGGAAVDPALQQLCGELGVAERLGVQVDERTMWCWLRWPLSRPVSLPHPAAPFMIAVGRPAEGLAGFRRSHRQALDALRIAELAGRQPGTITYYDEVDVATVCTADMERTRAFIQAELGALVMDDEATRRTRETLAVFYAANSNYRAAAVQLGVHHNTVRYRLQQAERALGRPVNERRLALELALHLTDLIGPTNSEGTSAGTG